VTGRRQRRCVDAHTPGAVGYRQHLEPNDRVGRRVGLNVGDYLLCESFYIKEGQYDPDWLNRADQFKGGWRLVRLWCHVGDDRQPVVTIPSRPTGRSLVCGEGGRTHRLRLGRMELLGVWCGTMEGAAMMVKIGYVRLLAYRMGLGDWRITLDKMLPTGTPSLKFTSPMGRSEPESNCPASSRTCPKGQRQTLVHELVHCHLERVRLSSLNWTGPLGKKATQMAVDEVHDHIEFAVDAIATAWAETLPLPPLPEGSDGRTSIPSHQDLQQDTAWAPLSKAGPLSTVVYGAKDADDARATGAEMLAASRARSRSKSSSHRHHHGRGPSSKRKPSTPLRRAAR